MTRWLLLLTSFVFLLAACSNAVREVGVIESDAPLDEEVISAPTIVQAGQTFTVTVRTYGGGCTEADGVDIKVEGDLAVLKPYDLTRIPSGNTFCPAIRTRPEHTAEITFEQPGSATVRIEGRSEVGNVTGGSSGQAVVEKTITVE